MSDPSRDRLRWHLSRAAFDRFLAALDADHHIAADRYERIRSRLVKLFEWRGCRFPEDQADETITRIIRRIDEGEVIHDPATFCYGVARSVLEDALECEEQRRAAVSRFRVALAEPSDDAEEAERRMACLRSCLSGLTPHQQQLIVEYYRDDKSERDHARKRLCAKLGLQINALRIRARRLSDRLDDCVGRCARRPVSLAEVADRSRPACIGRISEPARTS